MDVRKRGRVGPFQVMAHYRLIASNHLDFEIERLIGQSPLFSFFYRTH